MIQMCNTCNGMRQFCPFRCDRRYNHVQRNGSIGVFIYHKKIGITFFEHWFQNLNFLGKFWIHQKSQGYHVNMHDKMNQKQKQSEFTFNFGPPIKRTNSAIMKALLKLTSLPKFFGRRHESTNFHEKPIGVSYLREWVCVCVYLS